MKDRKHIKTFEDKTISNKKKYLVVLSINVADEGEVGLIKVINKKENFLKLPSQDLPATTYQLLATTVL